jgi:hypothetical protein
MQYPSSGPSSSAMKTPGAWEIAVPCGAYSVTVSVGDSSYSSSSTPSWDFSSNTVNVEGRAAITSFSPTDSTKFKGATKTVWVCDGNLTVDAIGGTNTKLNYIDVKRVDPKINFQPRLAPIPSGYVVDFGAAFSASRGYGWVRQDSLSNPTRTPLDMRQNTRDRDTENTDQYDQRLDTLIFMQYPASGPSSTAMKTPGAWEIVLPCWTYTVTVSVGDSAFSSSNPAIEAVSTHQIKIEGQPAISGFQPTDSTKFNSATRTVSVCDGFLTIDAIGGTNTKLNYIDIVPSA